MYLVLETAGMILEYMAVGIIATFAATELLVGRVVFGVGVGIGLDYGEDVIKNEYYRRRH